MEFPLKPVSPWTFCRRLPNPLVYLSYIFYFQGILVGPLCFYSDYIDCIEGSIFQVKQVGPTVVEANGEMVIVSVLPEVNFCVYLCTSYSWVLKKLILKYPVFKCHIKIKQECIPAGCVPPAHWPYLVVSHACPPQATMHPPEQPRMPPLEQPHMPPWSNHACPPREQPCMPPRATRHAPPEQPCMPPGATTHAPPPQQPRTPPPVNRMTNRCKNITLPQLRCGR